jgi:hypothetical protein
MQFYAIEIARQASSFKTSQGHLLTSSRRNRNGLNDWIYENTQAETAKAPENTSS